MFESDPGSCPGPPRFKATGLGAPRFKATGLGGPPGPPRFKATGLGGFYYNHVSTDQATLQIRTIQTGSVILICYCCHNCLKLKMKYVICYYYNLN